MAKITDTTTLDGIWLGSKYNEKRSIIAIPASTTAEEPGLLFLEANDSSGTIQDGIYIWGDSAGKLRYHTSRPTDENADGTMLDNTTIGGAANKALSNLASVAIATDVSPGTDSTYDLGASTPMYFAQSYIDRMYVNNTAYIDGATAGNLTFIGKMTIGSDAGTTNADFKYFFHTTNKFIVFDESADDIIITDATGLIFGGDESTADGVKFEFDGTSTFGIDAITANDSISIGETTATDVEFFGANYDIHWDPSADTWRMLDNTILGFGTGGSSDYDIGLKFDSASLAFTQKVAGTGDVDFGVDGKGVDCTWYAETGSDYMKWDQDGASNLGALIFEDSVIQVAGANSTYTLGISTDTFQITATDHANSKVTIGTAGTTNSCDFQWLSKTSGDHITFDGGALTAVFDDIDTTILGKLTTGASGDASNDDVKIFLHTANKFVVFDESADDVIFADAVGLIFGGDESTADGVKFEFDGTSTMAIDALTANDEISVGGTTDTDFRLNGTSAGVDVLWDSSADTLKLLSNAKLDLDGPVILSGTQTLTGAGAVDVTHPCTLLVTTAADALTLADGAEGQMKYILMKTDGGDGTLTPDNLDDGTTITFDDVGDDALLIFLDSNWNFITGAATLA